MDCHHCLLVYDTQPTSQLGLGCLTMAVNLIMWLLVLFHLLNVYVMDFLIDWLIRSFIHSFIHSFIMAYILYKPECERWLDRHVIGRQIVYIWRVLSSGITPCSPLKSQLAFQRNISPASARLKSKPSKNPAWSRQQAELCLLSSSWW
jgi:hypothetical protein